MAGMGSRMIQIGYNSLMHFTILANLKKKKFNSIWRLGRGAIANSIARWEARE